MEELKASGNAAFKKGDFASAVDFFSRAIDLVEGSANIENHHVLYSNRSAARVRRRLVESSFCRFDSGAFFWSSSSFCRRRSECKASHIGSVLVGRTRGFYRKRRGRRTSPRASRRAAFPFFSPPRSYKNLFSQKRALFARENFSKG